VWVSIFSTRASIARALAPTFASEGGVAAKAVVTKVIVATTIIAVSGAAWSTTFGPLGIFMNDPLVQKL
jgi:hypothetical protein